MSDAPSWADSTVHGDVPGPASAVYTRSVGPVLDYVESLVRTRPGNSYPLGATWDGSGVNFALFSENATGVELCLFDDGRHERRVPMTERTDQVWHIYLP